MAELKACEAHSREELDGVYEDLQCVEREIHKREAKQSMERSARETEAFRTVLLETHSFRKILGALQDANTYASMTLQLLRCGMNKYVSEEYLRDLLKEEFPKLRFEINDQGCAPHDIQVHTLTLLRDKSQ